MTYLNKTLPLCLVLSFFANANPTFSEIDYTPKHDFKVTATTNNKLADPHQSNQDAVVYVWPNTHSKFDAVSQLQTLQSNEYWQEVSAQELNAGIMLFTTSTEAFVRIAPKTQFSEGEAIKSPALDASQLMIKPRLSSTFEAVEQTISQQEMALAGFEDGSVALKTNASNLVGQLTLRSNQNLQRNSRYLVHVKEKFSNQLLQVSAANIYQPEEEAVFSLSAKIAGQDLDEKNTQLRLINSQGEATKLSYDGGKISLPDNLDMVGAYQGFYELELTSMKVLAGISVKRSIKVPFAQVVSTAELGQAIQVENQAAVQFSLPIKVAHPGRYAVKATLALQSTKGKITHLQTIEVANWLQGDNSIILPFTANAPSKSGSKLLLTNVSLVDQSRMMLLEQHVVW